MLKVVDHPLIKVKLTKLRDKNSGHLVFSENLDEIASLMVYEVLKDLPLKKIEIETPLALTEGYKYGVNIIIIGILRAGLGMVRGIHKLIPQARVGHIGLYRDEETFESHRYFFKVPDAPKNSHIVLADPMLATGVTANRAIELLKEKGFTKITLVCIVGVTEGITIIKKNHSDVNIYLAAIDPILNQKKYIIPGLGDAGDRIFGTK